MKKGIEYAEGSLSEIDIAYLAGLFDGEGSIGKDTPSRSRWRCRAFLRDAETT